jgi:hypothetical protein
MPLAPRGHLRPRGHSFMEPETLPEINLQLLVTGALLGGVGILVATLRSLPVLLARWLVRSFTSSVETRSWELMRAVNLWAAEQGAARRHAWAHLRNNEVKMESAPGVFPLRHGGRWFLVRRSREKQSENTPLSDVVSVATLGRSAEPIRDLMREASERVRLADRREPRVLWGGEGPWREIPSSPRPLASVVLPGGMADELVGAIETFLSAEDDYAAKGIPHRIGVAFDGPPGSGKSSAVRALCWELRLPLYIVDLSGKEMSDSRLISLLSDVSAPAAVLFSDLDAALSMKRGDTNREGGRNPGGSSRGLRWRSRGGGTDHLRDFQCAGAARSSPPAAWTHRPAAPPGIVNPRAGAPPLSPLAPRGQTRS